ncbi:MAG: LysR family transcriptional regulator [Actinomycetota bacterium]|nr:LysR family transcriptional regulator [Actinomycetota bacterium]
MEVATLGGVQLHQLRYVVSVAEERGFTRAAARLLVAQPSVSAAVRSLERELGTELFHRSGGGVNPTPAGEALLPWARQVLADCEAGRAAVGDLMGLRRGRLSLGATPTLTTVVLAPVLAQFHRHYPGLDVSLTEDGSRHLVSALEHGELDLAVVILPINHSWVRTEALADEELVLAVPVDHPLAGQTSVGIAELEDLPLVMFRDGYDLREATLAVCRTAGFAPTFAVEGLEMDGVLALTAAGLGGAVVPASVVSLTADLVAIPFRDRDLRRTIGLAYRRDRTPPPAARAFADALRSAQRSALLTGSPGNGQRATADPRGRKRTRRVPRCATVSAHGSSEGPG